MDEAMTTQQIAYSIEMTPRMLLTAIIPMHMFGIIEPIGYRDDTPAHGIGFYGLDILWQTTVHTRQHSGTFSGCHGCRIRERLLLTEVLYE